MSKRRYYVITGGMLILVILIFLFLHIGNSGDFGQEKNQTGQETIPVNVELSTDEGETETEDEFIVCIDPGHGGSDPGSYEGDIYESAQVLELSLLVRDYLESQGIRVIMTRTTDTVVLPEDRVFYANDNHADVLISIHRNYYDGWERVYGVEAWIHSTEPKGAKDLANYVLDRLSQVEGTNIRGLRLGTSDNETEDYIINRESQMTSMILEVGYLSDEGDNKLLEKNKEAYAQAIGLGIMDYMEIYR